MSVTVSAGDDLLVSGEINGTTASISGGRATKALSDANYTVVAAEYVKRILEYTGALTANRDIILPHVDGAEYIVFNNTTGGFSLVFKKSGGTGVTVAATKRATIYNNGSDYVRATADV